MNCVVCASKSVDLFKIIDKKKYWKCNFCLAKFLDKNHHLDFKYEKERYSQHNNRVDDTAYRSFLSKLSIPLIKKLSRGNKGLDFGCGHGPALADMIKSDGFEIDLYDPFFFPNENIFTKEYDFITCTETAEHFFHPHKEFMFLDKLLRKKGWLGIMTCFLREDELFENWYYRRDPTHVVFYAERTFEIIAEQRNWSCEIPNKDIALFCKN